MSRIYPTKTCFKIIHLSALAKLSVAPRKIPKEKIISQIESIIYRLLSEQADNIRRPIQVTNPFQSPSINIIKQE